ncbi:MAG: hypothetical protein ACFB10_10555 [Salibacteraceae bacterium]
MKNMLSTASMALVFFFSLLQYNATAQSFTAANCCNATPVAKECVGASSHPSVIQYQLGPLCSSLATQFCVTTEFSNLCPSHDATAFVFVDGVFVTSGDITDVGSCLSFTAQCPALITVVAFANPNGSGINCIQLGNACFYLRQA